MTEQIDFRRGPAASADSGTAGLSGLSVFATPFELAAPAGRPAVPAIKSGRLCRELAL
jgi:hypothetical protein